MQQKKVKGGVCMMNLQSFKYSKDYFLRVFLKGGVMDFLDQKLFQILPAKMQT